jgi:DNA-binding CsgD family transcriptional regulator
VQDNQVAYCAVSAQEPAGKPLRECQRVAVHLTLHLPEDLTSTDGSVGALRETRLLRLCQEACDQGALLTQEDLALLLTTSVSTVKRHLRRLRAAGQHPPTRGQQRDIGPGLSHKVQVIQRYLAGEELSQIGRRLPHGLDSMERYLQAFRQVALMTGEGLDRELIAKACRLSAALVAQYQELLAGAADQPHWQRRLDDLLAPAAPQKGALR